MNPAIALLIRDALKIFSGFLVAKGLADDGTAEVIVAGLLAITGVVWTRVAKRQAQPATTPGPGAQLLALAGAFALACGTTGCQTSGKLLASTCQTAGAAMEGWATYVALGKATPAQEAQVKAAWEKFQAAELVAERAYLAGTKTGDLSGFDQAAQVMRSAQVDLLRLIDTFQPEPSP